MEQYVWDAGHHTQPAIGIQRAISWNADDYSKIMEYTKRIQFANFLHEYDHAYMMTKILNSHIKKRANDHKPNKLYHMDNIESIDAILGFNKITTRGIIEFVKKQASQPVDDFVIMSIGTSKIPEAIGQKALYVPVARLPILLYGGVTAKGNVLNHVGTFGYGLESNTYYEFGIHNAPLGGIMFSRSVIESGLKQEQNNTFLTGSHSAVFEVK